MELVDRLAPAELRASTQSLLTMANFTLGGALGHLLLSALFEAYGARCCYLATAVFSTASTLVFGLAAAPYMREERARQHQQQEL